MLTEKMIADLNKTFIVRISGGVDGKVILDMPYTGREILNSFEKFLTVQERRLLPKCKLGFTQDYLQKYNIVEATEVRELLYSFYDRIVECIIPQVIEVK